MISFSNVNYSYQKGTSALSDISFHVDKGEFVFLVGVSGAGKSSILKLIFRETVAGSGQVAVLARNLNRLRRREVPYLRRQIGVVYQDFRLLPEKTAAENVAFALEVIEANPKEIKRQVPRVLNLVGLGDKGARYPHQLSGGEQQRVAMARALVNNPPLLVCDEPTGNLDPDTSWQIMTLLSQINLLGTTVFIATHDKEVVDRMGRRVLELQDGRLVRDDSKGVYRHEA
ncbi:MAG: cell division ATP-binding protein FtsE [Eubacteriales bacterium]|nr:cell division ATP-binding protein FtsE [Eubacteriales bacterium]MDD3073449.1 cell division ATP-binding protein FtsE [Eubacteriales bacterium]MDD4078993.1 cell division ATP-binding protein FtsE [Eubacteriales bacterium]MDD4769149.1 cell division ATP-binding protein FtsE [Eubacteriales bacterium]